jgi:hypothetical protein
LTESFGIPVISQQAESIYRQFGQRTAQIIYQGTAAQDQFYGVDFGMKGLTNIASPTGLNTSSYNTVKWNTTLGPSGAVRNMAGTLETDSLDAPYALVLGTGTQTGLWTIATNTADTQIKMVNEILTSPDSVSVGQGNATIVIENFGADSGNTVNPMPAVGAADNVGLLLKPAAQYYQALIGVPPSIDLGPMDTHGRHIPGKAVAQIGIIIPQPQAICYHDRIDYA